MKMIYAIVNNDDSSAVQNALTTEGFVVTKLATTGGFLKVGNTTFITVVEDDREDAVIDIIRKHSKRRTQMAAPITSYGMGNYTAFPVEVTVGGATVFVTSVDRFEKI